MKNNMKNLRCSYAFSLIELLISLIVISCITAAFTPVITKKLKTSAVSLNAASSEITTECSSKFSDSCKLCTKSYCIQCELSNCEIGKYAENKTCSCKDCSNLFPDCLECDNTKCTKCLQTHYIKDKKCEPCPSDKICDGINAYDKTYCTNPPEGYFCDGNTPKRCTDKYSMYCLSCNSSGCSKCANNFYLENGICKSCTIGCSTCLNATYCTKCWDGRLLNEATHDCSSFICQNLIPNCSNCTSPTVCTKCVGRYFVNSSNTCSPCKDTLPNCLNCTNSSTCTQCDTGYYLNSNKTCSRCSIENCVACDTNGSCSACKPGYTRADNGTICKENSDKFNCSDLNFMKIGNLCVTRKNMGDSLVLSIPASVTVAAAGSDYCYTYESKCCWKGTTSVITSMVYGYQGGLRTVCNHQAAEEICAKFNYAGKKWRLARANEMENWGIATIGLGTNGLMLGDWAEGFGLDACSSQQFCPGAYQNFCAPWQVWGAKFNDSYSHYAAFRQGVFGIEVQVNSYALSVRCVTEMN